MADSHKTPTTASNTPELIDICGGRFELVARMGTADTDTVLFRTRMAAGKTVPLRSHVDPECSYVLSGRIEAFLFGERPRRHVIEANHSLLIADGVNFSKLAPAEMAQLLGKPEGEAGRGISEILSRANSGVTEAVHQRLRLEPGDSVLEIGFGNGKLLPALLAQADDLVYVGLDIAAAMAAEALAFNADLVASGRAALRSVFPDRSPPAPPSGMLSLSDADRLASEMSAAGLSSTEGHRFEGVWRGGVGDAYF